MDTATPQGPGLESREIGWHFLQLPGPTNIPSRIRNAMDKPAIDQRGKQFARLALKLFGGMKRVFKTRGGEIFIYPSSGTGAGEAALVNTLSAGDKILMFDSGWFSLLWIKMARQFGLSVEVMENDWRRAPDPEAIEARLAEDKHHAIKAVFVVHNETSTGVAARIPEIRQALDDAGHPALYIVDTISSLASMDFRMDEWGIDVAIGGSQKGLMLPPGLSFNAVSEKARRVSEHASLPKCYWDWRWHRECEHTGFFPYTPAINLFYGLEESLKMLLREEGLENVFNRHARLGEATRRAVGAWGLETVCREAREHSDSITAVLVPEGHDADRFRSVVLDRFNMALGGGLQRFAGKAFRIGHMGDVNDLMLSATLSGVEMGMDLTQMPHTPGGAAAAERYLALGE
ncbi:MAG: aminotransferase class V-fold PLP-dependent enzyme [Gammaproteobacteria bacterium]|nr:aminotransferase class V-fold PLP-dependent enzyme [Gammaproteobacteria bacterium]NIR83767.1 aminotransferase class V-fold PLP-dependent enzyme [Gammaproteobacteria bacterium]NIR88125.1 aminotransferase class V-fold PLP-dependent enzyme [Gammaproteobacteria bacterium]NIU05084.1 aminotransferase class V-fold PLP-dependent enzyme [Gammaproteobacteria bacterium]NIV51927.1 aminotransferase class V-fold PLP-dependent enzyme [Gammaproteobacteria bacterium]